jgi:hypothetical protein
MNVEICRSL